MSDRLACTPGQAKQWGCVSRSTKLIAVGGHFGFGLGVVGLHWKYSHTRPISVDRTRSGMRWPYSGRGRSEV